MPTRSPKPPQDVLERLRKGGIFPAHPLALDRDRRFDEAHQRALTRYYMAAGTDGLAVGVSTTQYAIRDRRIGLYAPVLELAAETMHAHQPPKRPPLLRVAGIHGNTTQAVEQARIAAGLGYHAGLISSDGAPEVSPSELIRRARAVAEIIPLIAFDAKPTAATRSFGAGFWHRLLEIENLVALNTAAGGRYETLEAIRAVVESGRAGDVALYSGDGRNLIADLLTPFDFGNGVPPARIVGALLGPWAVGTRSAAQQVLECQRITVRQKLPAPQRMLAVSAQLADICAAIFDAANGFAGCIPGVHEVLRRQGLMASAHCLDPKETLSAGQGDEISRAHSAYPHLNDDTFIAEHLDHWLS